MVKIEKRRDNAASFVDESTIIRTFQCAMPWLSLSCSFSSLRCLSEQIPFSSAHLLTLHHPETIKAIMISKFRSKASVRRKQIPVKASSVIKIRNFNINA
jgi:hypothetical protein